MKKALLLFFAMVLAGCIMHTHAQLELRIVKTGEDAGVDISYDDGEYENDSIDKLYDDDLDMGWEGEKLNIMTSFLRFQNVAVPQGLVLDSAIMTLWAHEDEADEARVTVYAEAIDNSPAFADDEALTDRTWTSASVSWIINDAWVIWMPYTSPDLAPVIQEVINRPGWVSGNALTLFFNGENQGASLLDNARDFESFENIEDPDDGGDGLHHPERIPKLTLYATYLSLDEGSKPDNMMIVYPNPVTDGKISVAFNKTENAQVYVIDITGQVVLTEMINEKYSTINASQLNTGVYYIQAITEDATYTKKVLIK